MDVLTAVVLVGGEGTRLRPLTLDMPKPMVPVLNRPFLEHFLLRLREHGVQRAILASGYLPDAIREYFGDGSEFGMRIDYVVEDSPLGTAGAVKNAARDVTSTFLVLNGDVMMDLDITALLKQHRDTNAEATLSLYKVEDPSRYGVVPLDAQGRVLQFIEKPPGPDFPTHYINSGCYALEPSVLDIIPDGQFSMFEREAFPQLLERKAPLYGFQWEGYWRDMGTVQSYVELHHDILEDRVASAYRRTGISMTMGDDCQINATAQLIGPIVMGRGCRVGAGARIIGPTVLGDGCDIGDGAVVESSILWSGAKVSAGATMRGSVAARNVSLEEGAIVDESCVLATGMSVTAKQHVTAGTVLQAAVA